MDAYQAYARHVNPGLGRFLELSGRDKRLVLARGAVLVDDQGREYDDWVAGFGSANLGHNRPEILEAIREHLESGSPSLFEENLNPHAGRLAARLVELTGGAFETVFFSNSGSEAVEAAIKAAIAATGRAIVACAEGAYHGTTLGALSAMQPGIYRDPFEGALAPVARVPYGELGPLEARLARGDVAVYLVEPIQVDGGVRIPPPDYFQGVREVCSRHGTLLAFDEVQTGMGRTGDLFLYQGLGVEPDLLALAKSLGGGVVPIGATLHAPALWERAYGPFLRNEIHSSTFGGNALSCRVAESALELASDPAFLAAVREKGERLFGEIEERVGAHPLVRRISHLGLLGGIALAEPDHPWFRWENLGLPELAGLPISGPLLVERLGRERIHAQICAHDWSVLRVEPPLVVGEDACRRFVAAVRNALDWMVSHG